MATVSKQQASKECALAKLEYSCRQSVLASFDRDGRPYETHEERPHTSLEVLHLPWILRWILASLPKKYLCVLWCYEASIIVRADRSTALLSFRIQSPVLGMGGKCEETVRGSMQGVGTIRKLTL